MSIDRNELYKCSDENCSAIFEVVNACPCSGECEIDCCGKPMEKLHAKTADSSTEKHVPIFEKLPDGYMVKVGSTPHPMEENHYIQFIELRCKSCDMIMRKYLKPGDKPEAFFPCNLDTCDVSFYEHCNIHGLWQG